MIMNSAIMQCTVSYVRLALWISVILVPLIAYGETGDKDPQNSQMASPANTRLSETELSALFSKAHKQFEKENFSKASELFYQYLEVAQPESNNYEWAQFFLGISLFEIGLTHASVDLMATLVREKPNTRIVSYIIDMFEKITVSQPFDFEEVIENSVSSGNYSFLEPRLQDFIYYERGKMDWRHGLDDWGHESFSRIRPGTYYFMKAQYQKALYSLYKKDLNRTIELLHSILNAEQSLKGSPDYRDDLFNQTRWTLARLYYELKEYDRSKRLFSEITTPLAEQALFLLEQAWIYFREQNYEKAMGLLYAFNAPDYKDFFTPEYFILKSLIYKRVCYYGEALSVVQEFRDRYGQSLSAIYNRTEVSDKQSRQILSVSLKDPDIAKQLDFLELLQNEKMMVRKLDAPLSKYLQKLYRLQIEDSARRFKLSVEEHYKTIANQLLKYSEEADLIEYELGVDRYQRVRERRFEKNGENNSENDSNHVIYQFQHEFWNDELGDLEVSLPSKCEQSDNWEVFLQ